jgi:hypothetical protein
MLPSAAAIMMPYVADAMLPYAIVMVMMVMLM